MAGALPIDREIPATHNAWSGREWEALTAIARRQGITPEAVVRAFVQRGLAAGVLPGPRRPRAVAVVVTDAAGRRLCPVCRVRPLVKRTPGPGRFPSCCEECRDAGRG